MLPHKTFIYLFLTPLLFLMTSMTFCVVRGLYRRCKHVVYDICGPPTGILFICLFICLFIYLFIFEVGNQSCHNTYACNGVQELTLL